MYNESKFMEMVVRECQKRSQMTYLFSNRNYQKFRKWFFKQGKKHFKWTNGKCEFEFDIFAKAFNLKIK